MNFLKSLFGNNEVKKEEVKRKIEDFFQIDINNIPDETFILAEKETNSSGIVVQNFRKKLETKECGIFDIVEVKLIGEKGKNVFFITHSTNNINFDKMKQLFDDLYLIYGTDDQDRTKFTKADKEQFNDEMFHLLWGRSWMESGKYQYPIAISRDENEVSFGIWMK